MNIINGHVLTDQWTFEPLDLVVEKDRIADLNPHQQKLETKAAQGTEATFDASGLLVIPGLFDIHIHACAGHDFCDADPAGMAAIAHHLASRGITSFLGTSMALDEARLAQVFEAGYQVIQSNHSAGATLRGIHMEGPFFAVAKKGAQAADFIIDPDVELFKRLEVAAGHQIRIVDVAPERPGALELVSYAAPHTTVSLAHTEANYLQATAAFMAGASHVTHLFNAMPPFNHRDPGVVGAASDAGASVELICDGVHIHPSVIRSVFNWFPADKIVLVSDAMRACGLADGTYDLGGQAVRVQGNRATLADGTLAGSVTDLMQGLRNAVRFGVPLIAAVRAATDNQARVARLNHEVGSLSIGKKADLLVITQDLTIKAVMIGGQFHPVASV